MNEHEALQVVLVKSLEAQGREGQFLSDAERRHATRAALAAVGAQGAPDAFIAARARFAIDAMAGQHPVVNKLMRQDGWHSAWLLLATGVGLLLGITADVFGSARELNLLAPPAWLVIVWNLGVYFLLFARLLGAGRGESLPGTGWIAQGVRSLMDFGFRRSTTALATSGAHAGVLADFSAAWSRACQPLITARISTLLHAASAAIAVALIAGMYLRGLALEYRVSWSSTFLQAETVHGLLSFLLAPAVYFSGITLPDAAQMEALRDAPGLGREDASAAPWIHLYAVTLTLFVVLPRTLMALWSRWRAHRLAVHFPLSLNDSYYRGLLRLQRGEPTQVLVLPYGRSLTDSAELHLRDALAQAFDDSPAIALASTTAPGTEDDLGNLAPALAGATHVVAVFDMTATPEAEHHAAFLSALQAATKAPPIIAVNEGGFARRFRDYPQRLGERREAWSRFAQAVRKRPLFLDLEKAQTSATVGELRRVIDALAESPHG